MDQNTQQTYTPPNSPTNTGSSPKKTSMAIVMLVVALILILAALYLFASRMDSSVPNTTDSTNASAVNEAPAVAPVTNTSDDMDSIQADLNASTQGVDGQSI